MRHYTRDSINLDIDAYQEIIGLIYSGNNNGLEFEYYYAYLDRTAGYLGKSIIEGTENYTKFLRPISWLFSLSNYFGISLEEEFLKKYPKICPYCLEARCVCIKTNKTPLEEKAAYKVEEELYFRYKRLRGEDKKYKLDDAVDIIREIFYVNEIIWHHTNAEHHISKIHEEIAEIHSAYCSYVQNNSLRKAIPPEIADVFAWVLGAWAIVYPETSLDSKFIDYYIDGCPVCKQPVCICNRYNGRPVGDVDFRQLMNVEKSLNKIYSTFYPQDEKLKELVASFTTAIEHMHEPTAKLAILHTKQWIDGIAKVYVVKSEVAKIFDEVLNIFYEMEIS